MPIAGRFFGMEDRRAAILRAVVSQYIETSQPVSSNTIADAPGVSASSATVRSQMASLEREGFLQQPHTSAGRIPTDRGYRFFVDELNEPGSLLPAQTSNVRTFFNQASGELEEMMVQTGALLTSLTGTASMITTVETDSATVRSVQIVTLSTTTALVVVVYSDGNVEKRTIDIDSSVDNDIAARVSAQLSAAADGKSLSDVSVNETGDKKIDALAKRVLGTMQLGQREGLNERVYVAGASSLASSFQAVDVVRNILTILEQQYVVVTLIKNLLDRNMTVSIGAEHELAPLAQCSLVMAPTFVDGERRGAVAVLGPTRMDYAHAMAAVTLVSNGLSDRLAN